MFIYKTTNLINGKIYIGKYCGKYNNYLGSGKKLKEAIKTYGKENFTKEILEDDINNHDILCEREIYWIGAFDSTNPTIGYNISHGGESGQFGVPWSDEQKKKLSESNSGEKNGMYGKKHNKNIKNIIARTGQGRKRISAGSFLGVRKIGNHQWQSRYSNIYLGTFYTEILAAHYYNIKAIEIFGNNAIINDLSQDELENAIKIECEIRRKNKENKKSKYRGVSVLDENKNKWRAFCTIDNKYIHIGTFKTEEEAALAYNEFVNEELGWKAKEMLNDVDFKEFYAEE